MQEIPALDLRADVPQEVYGCLQLAMIGLMVLSLTLTSLLLSSKAWMHSRCFDSMLVHLEMTVFLRLEQNPVDS